MKRTVLALALACLAGPAAATVIEVPVPELVGIYQDESRTATVHLPATPSVIHGVSVRIVGSTVLASYSCDGYGGYGPPQPVPTDISVELPATTGGWLVQRFNEASGPVSWTLPFASYLGADWSMLLDGTTEIGLSGYGVPAIMECVLVGPGDTVTIDEVTLLVDGEFPTPAGGTSWGRVKSIYR